MQVALKPIEQRSHERMYWTFIWNDWRETLKVESAGTVLLKMCSVRDRLHYVVLRRNFINSWHGLNSNLPCCNCSRYSWEKLHREKNTICYSGRHLKWKPEINSNTYPSGSQGAWPPVRLSLSVGSWLTFEPPALHHTLKALSNTTKNKNEYYKHYHWNYCLKMR